MRRDAIFMSAMAAALALSLYSSAGRAQTRPASDALTSATKTQVIEELLKQLKANYVFPETADRAAEAIHADARAGKYDGLTEGKEFARLLTEDLRPICKDAHLRIFYSADALPVRKQSSQPTADEIRQMMKFEKHVNSGVERVERLDGNLGYLELRGFMDPHSAARPIQAAMDFLADTDALIIDLRRNGGGDPATVRLLCSYLFDPTPIHINDIYFRQGNQTTQFWTLRRIPGRRYLHRDIYLLTSRRTASGAEEFCYDLQNVKRATIIGEVTWGGANPGDRFRLTDHFSAFIPEGRAINPYTKTNWEGVGIQPDVRVSADQALQTAQALALKRLLEKASAPEDKESLTTALKALEAPSPHNAAVK